MPLVPACHTIMYALPIWLVGYPVRSIYPIKQYFQRNHSTKFNKMTTRFLVIGLLLNATVFAQNNVSGTWTLQSKQHVLGPQYANALPKQINISQQADSLIIETINIGGNGQDVSSRQAVAMDGKPATTTGATSKRKLVKSLKWNADKKGLVLTIVFYVPDNPSEVDFTRVETWSLSPDGKQLNIQKRSVETRSETWEVKGMYERK